MSSEPLWKVVLVAALLLFFAAYGVRVMIEPDLFVRRSGMPKGGELLRTWNRDSMRLGGAVFTAGALYLLYRLITT